MSEEEKSSSPSEQNGVPPVSGNGEQPPPFVTVPAADMEKLERELNDYKEKYLRMMADADNVRKRMQKERQELVQYAVEQVIVELLAPIDQLELALGFAGQSSAEIKHWALGFQMILKQFKDILANHGVTEFHSQGQRFDPHEHEAIEVVYTDDFPPGMVVEESRRGYKMGKKTIRPARVKVAKALEDAPAASSEEFKDDNV